MRTPDALLIVVASANLLSTQSIARAATDCITEPKPAGPGQHWYYRVDPVSHDKCWFAAQSTVQARHTAPQSQPPSKPLRDTGTKMAPDLKNGERSNRPNSSSEQVDRDALYREFVLWDLSGGVGDSK
jgi:hypothetical protein